MCFAEALNDFGALGRSSESKVFFLIDANG